MTTKYKVVKFIDTADHFDTISQAVKLIRSNILKREKWEFTVDIKGFMILQEFKSFSHWIITGLKSILDIYYSKKKESKIFIDIVGQIIINSVKTRTQVNYITNKNF